MADEVENITDRELLITRTRREIPDRLFDPAYRTQLRGAERVVMRTVTTVAVDGKHATVIVLMLMDDVLADGPKSVAEEVAAIGIASFMEQAIL
jgi:hypothetical protein